MNVPFSQPNLSRYIQEGSDAAVSKVTFPDGTSQTTATAGDPTKIENGNSSMEIATSNGACVFTPNGDAALTTTFAADGNVGINDTAPAGGKLCVNGVTYLNGSSTGGLIITRNTYATPGEREWLISNHLSSGIGSSQLHFRNVVDDTISSYTVRFSGGGAIICSGTVTANGTVLTSDDRIKENEKLIVNATETLSKLTPQIYDKYLNMDLSGSSTIESGLIAQEVYYNAPELRHLVVVGKDYDTSGNEYTPTPEEMDLSGVDIADDPDYGSHGWSKTEQSGLHYQGLIPYLIKSNQELAERLAALENK
jgi:hypothetical protein